MTAEAGIDWTPEMITRAMNAITADEKEAETEDAIAEAMADHADVHRRYAETARRRVKVLTERMARDGVWADA